MLYGIWTQLANHSSVVSDLGSWYGCVALYRSVHHQAKWHLATSGVECYIDFTLHRSALLNISQLKPFITSVIVSTLALNLIATSASHKTPTHPTLTPLSFVAMIVYKIWAIERQTRRLAGDAISNDAALTRAIHIVVESGGMYTAAVVCGFGVYLAGNNSGYAVSDCVRSFAIFYACALAELLVQIVQIIVRT